MLYIDGNPITAHYTKALTSLATTPFIAEYYKTRYAWINQTLDIMDWDAFGKANWKFSTSEQQTIHKYIYNWLPTGDILKVWYGITVKCPHCSKKDTRDQCKGQQLTPRGASGNFGNGKIASRQ